MEIYQGVMYQTYRAHVRNGVEPQIAILSARHSFVGPSEWIDPYDQRMTAERAEEMLDRLPHYTGAVRWPSRVGGVFLVGGKDYRRVMHAAIDSMATADLPVREVCGGIGLQRSQLAQFLGALAPAFAEQVGCHPNGTALFRRHGQFAVGDTVALTEPSRPHLAPKRAVLKELFVGPAGVLRRAPMLMTFWRGDRKSSAVGSPFAKVRDASALAEVPPAFASNSHIGDVARLSGEATFSI
nr:DUF6884 domain-containing protein [uncultured Cupriavidus sp.]